MNYLVLDLEWNQPYGSAEVWKQRFGTSPAGEIIQIGAVSLDEKARVTGGMTQLVRPTFLKKMHGQVKKLTGLDIKTLQGAGVPFKQANALLRRLCREDTVILTWGPDDIPMLRANLLLYGMEDWVGASWCDLQQIYAMQTGASGQKALHDAMDELGILPDRPPHDAYNDAWFTAKIAQRLDLERGVREYRAWRVRRQEEKRRQELLRKQRREKLPLVSQNIGTYQSRAEAFEDRSLVRMFCPVCRRRLKQTSWYKVNGQYFAAMGKCPEHGEFVGQMRLTRSRKDNLWRAKRQIYQGSLERVAKFERLCARTAGRRSLMKKGG